MKKVLLLALTLFPALAPAQTPKLEYNVYYRYYFENREFDYKLDSPVNSGTINALLLTPSVGLSVFQSPRVNHRLAFGADIRRDMGGRNGRFIDELSIYYDAHVRLDNGAMFEGSMGVFPRRFCEGEYSRAFFSDSLRFADSNLEGALLKYRSLRFYAELGADWMGQRGRFIKERFMILTAGHWDAAPWLRLGWSGTFYHYAGSETAPGVVDNNLLNPYLKFNFAEASRFQELSLKLGIMGSYQWDREREASQSIKLGGEAVFRASKWNVSLQNSAFYGKGFQYLYEKQDLGGNKYGNMLYFGSPFYAYDFYDRLEAAWTPKIWRGIFLCLKASFHFCGEGYIGNSQTLGLVFDLDNIRHPDWGAGRSGAAIGKRRRSRSSYYL